MSKFDHEKLNKRDLGLKSIREEQFNNRIKVVYLDVPYSEKEEAKKFGARWDSHFKTWWCLSNNLSKLSKWLPDKK
jgi:hypothetical protein